MTEQVVTPDPTFVLLSGLVQCLCDTLENAGVPTCYCGLFPGSTYSDEYNGDCEAENCGTAWVRLMNAYPAVAVGNISEQPGNCGFGTGLDIEVGITRCISVGDSYGNPPTPDDLLIATQRQVSDMWLMHNAILCCPHIALKDTMLGPYTPVGPGGGSVGGFWTMSVVVF